MSNISNSGLTIPFKLLLLFLLLLPACSSNNSQEDTKPNLLIIQTDEHSFRTLGCYRKTMAEDQAFIWGNDIAVETPHIDWLADHGVLCTSFYATTPVCSPSRASFMTGRYPQHTPVVTNNVPLQDGLITFAQILSDQGYATGYTGKWHLDGDGKPQWAPERKFGFQDNRYMFNRGHYKQLEVTETGPRVVTHNPNGVPNYDIEGADSINFTTDFLTRKTIEFIRQHRDEAFCYMVSIPDPHGPNTVRSPYDTIYNDLLFEKPLTNRVNDEDLPAWAKKAKRTVNKMQMARYFGMVKCIDDNVGKIIHCLRGEGILDQTIIVFTSDHGDMCGEHGLDNKGIPFEASTKIPFIIHYPGVVPESGILNVALGCVDFQPTILSLMGAHTSGMEEGRNAAMLFKTLNIPKDWEDIVFVRGTSNESAPSSSWAMAVSDRYKLVFSDVEDDEPWLIDLQEDPDELINFFENPKYNKVVQEMSKALRQYGLDFDDKRVLANKIQNELNQILQ